MISTAWQNHGFYYRHLRQEELRERPLSNVEFCFTKEKWKMSEFEASVPSGFIAEIIRANRGYDELHRLGFPTD